MTLIDVLREARSLLSRPGNDFAWSSWEGADQALEEIDGVIERVRSGCVEPIDVAFLFAPTGPIQEVSQSSGWGREFLALADRFDAALEDYRMQDAGKPAVRAAFACSVCGEPAGAIELRGAAGRAELRRESFTGTLSQPLTSEAFGRLNEALATGDAGVVFGLDPEYAPFYCPACRASYCAAHWDRWDVFDEDMPDWHDSIRGRCPRGHGRMLED